MEAYRPDRVVRIMTGMVSFTFYGTWVVAALILIVAPGARELTPDLAPTLALRVNLPELGASAVSQWDLGSREVAVRDATAILVRPTSQLPAWFGPVTYLALATLFAMVLLFLQNLRALFRRVREGAPFDADNAARMRRLGVWLLAFHVFYGAFEFWMSWNLSRDLASSGIPIGPAVDLNIRCTFPIIIQI